MGQGQEGHIEKVIKLQNCNMRIINAEDLHAKESQLYSRKGILKLQDITRLQNCLLVHGTHTASML